jgi:NAD-dependent dihydropyrimidine dehydrogenase PreA subunit
MELKIKITSDCDLCLDCVDACRSDIITEDILQEAIDNDGVVIVSDKCQYCESCTAVCSEEVITVINPRIEMI